MEQRARADRLSYERQQDAVLLRATELKERCVAKMQIQPGSVRLSFDQLVIHALVNYLIVDI
eukprot:SAG31_NODE_296_length_18227_cov_39.663173_13_plen_62_part_00